MIDFDYKKTHDLCVAFRKLGNQEFQIFEYLFTMNYFEGNLVDLAKAVNIDISATRKAVLKLQNKYEIVCTVQKENSNRYIAFFVVDGWMDNLLKNTQNMNNPLSNIKRIRKNKKGDTNGKSNTNQH